ncbi:hypothetical protein Tco_0453627 [Tanacetum coccineum]
MMGVLAYFLGFQIKQSERGISINQEKYVKALLKKYDINGSSVKTPMVPPNKLGSDFNGKAVNEIQYRGMIGSLMYLTASRPDIQFSTCLCARYHANLKESHLITIKRIFRYLKGTPSLGLWYPKCPGFDLKGYSNSDYVGCNMDRKSTSCACQLLRGKLVCWSAKKHQSVAMSSIEAEYVVVARCCANILWMKSQLTDYDIIYKKVPIFCDNTSAIAISNNLVLHSRTKHIDIRYHFIRHHILKGDIELHFIPTQYQLADSFIKPLDDPTFKRFIVELVQFLEAFIKALTQYVEYLVEFWYTAKTLEDSKVWVSTLIGVSPPSLKVVRAWVATIGYNMEIWDKGTLKKSCLPPRLIINPNQVLQCSQLGHQAKEPEMKDLLYSNMMADLHVLKNRTQQSQALFKRGAQSPMAFKEKTSPGTTKTTAPPASLQFLHLFFYFHSESASRSDVSANSTAEADPEISDPYESIP